MKLQKKITWQRKATRTPGRPLLFPDKGLVGKHIIIVYSEKRRFVSTATRDPAVVFAFTAKVAYLSCSSTRSIALLVSWVKCNRLRFFYKAVFESCDFAQPKMALSRPRRRVFPAAVATSILLEELDASEEIPEDEDISWSDPGDPDFIPNDLESKDHCESEEEDAVNQVQYIELRASSSNDVDMSDQPHISAGDESSLKENDDLTPGADTAEHEDALNQENVMSHMAEYEDALNQQNSTYFSSEEAQTVQASLDKNDDVMLITDMAEPNDNPNQENSTRHPVEHKDTPNQPDSMNGSSEENQRQTDNADRGSRKRRRDESQWKKTVAKVQRQSGQEYISIKSGKLVSKRSVQNIKDCSNCKYKCREKISAEEQTNINRMFWSLSDVEKNHFYSQYTQRSVIARSRAVTNEKPKLYSYQYFLRAGSTAVKEQVCKVFFLSTLDVSQRRVSYFYEHKRCVETGAPLPPKSGKNIKNKIGDDLLGEVRNHIRSFPRVPSHYCRESSKREYLEKSLNLSKMYGLYKASCEEKGIEAVKQHKYAEIFNNDFNIGFIAPKKDRCDKCELGRVNPNMQGNEKDLLDLHVSNYKLTVAERERDRVNKNKPVVCFDLENVFSLPVSGVSNFFCAHST
ncbi:hypothetical protein PoB_004487600 [Plakobranchus ocellatus]|uniref:Uncharacterized protein n=1 Tax=Plakobranchus ocellatus TaxID=259542 RepID=A0AAV4B4U5_9GAST|nr:hypothetical protein PoB_004487600 [Plakobranchus ocellatus]